MNDKEEDELRRYARQHLRYPAIFLGYLILAFIINVAIGKVLNYVLPLWATITLGLLDGAIIAHETQSLRGATKK